MTATIRSRKTRNWMIRTAETHLGYSIHPLYGRDTIYQGSIAAMRLLTREFGVRRLLMITR